MTGHDVQVSIMMRDGCPRAARAVQVRFVVLQRDLVGFDWPWERSRERRALRCAVFNDWHARRYVVIWWQWWKALCDAPLCWLSGLAFGTVITHRILGLGSWLD